MIDFSAHYFKVLPASQFWAWALGAWAFAAAGLYFFLRGLLRARIIEDVPTSRVRSAPQGYVELVGIGRNLPGPPVVSPLSGKACLWFSYQIDERRPAGRAGERSGWKTISSGTSEALFSLEDPTGVCIVDPVGAKVVPHASERWYGDSAWPRGASRVHSGSYRYREKRLEKDRPLYAIGEFRTLGTPLADETADAAALLRDLKRDPARMQAFDRNRDGKVDMHEWKLARLWARREARRQILVESPVAQQNLLEAGSGERPYIVSGRSQGELVMGYRLQAVLGLAMMLGALPVAAWVLLVRFAA